MVFSHPCSSQPRQDKTGSPSCCFQQASTIPPSWSWGNRVPWISSLKISWTPIHLNYSLSWSVFACSHIFPGLFGTVPPRSAVFSEGVSKGCGGESRESVAPVRKPFSELHIAGSRSVSLSACFHQPCSSCSHLLITRGWHPAPFSTAIPALYLLQAHYDPR